MRRERSLASDPGDGRVESVIDDRWRVRGPKRVGPDQALFLRLLACGGVVEDLRAVLKTSADSLVSRSVMGKCYDLVTRIGEFELVQVGRGEQRFCFDQASLKTAARGLVELVGGMVRRGEGEPRLLSNTMMMLMTVTRSMKEHPTVVQDRLPEFRRGLKHGSQRWRSVDILGSLVHRPEEHVESLRTLSGYAVADEKRVRGRELQELAAAATYLLDDDARAQRAEAFANGDYRGVLDDRLTAGEHYGTMALQAAKSLNEAPIQKSKGMSLMRAYWTALSLERSVELGQLAKAEAITDLVLQQTGFFVDGDFDDVLERLHRVADRASDLSVQRRRIAFQALRSDAAGGRIRPRWK